MVQIFAIAVLSVELRKMEPIGQWCRAVLVCSSDLDDNSFV